jgi:hypothetical protein
VGLISETRGVGGAGTAGAKKSNPPPSRPPPDGGRRRPTPTEPERIIRFLYQRTGDRGPTIRFRSHRFSARPICFLSSDLCLLNCPLPTSPMNGGGWEGAFPDLSPDLSIECPVRDIAPPRPSPFWGGSPARTIGPGGRPWRPSRNSVMNLIFSGRSGNAGPREKNGLKYACDISRVRSPVALPRPLAPGGRSGYPMHHEE